MNKAELIADLTANVVRVIDIAVQPDPVKEAAGVKVYAANTMEMQDDGRLQGRTIAFYVVDEGQPEETAYYKDKITAPAPYVAQATAYLMSLPYVRFKVIEQSAALGYLIADVWSDNGDGTMSKKQIMAYFEADGTPAHKEVI